ncbi:MAG: hypothetical protein ACFFCW_38375, partial [Candidatus Hodarchaeota archaeon]
VFRSGRELGKRFVGIDLRTNVRFRYHWNESVLELRNNRRLSGFIPLPSAFLPRGLSKGNFLEWYGSSRPAVSSNVVVTNSRCINQIPPDPDHAIFLSEIVHITPDCFHRRPGLFICVSNIVGIGNQ